MKLTPLDEAFERLNETIKPLSSEKITISDALGRVVSEDITSLVNQPPCAVSSMDGYAVLHKDVLEMGKKNLEIIGKSQAGGPFEGDLKPGQSVRIFTGAALPDGADCVMMQEDAVVQDKQVHFNEVGFEGKYVTPKGYDFEIGKVLIKAGTLITSRHVGLLCAMNVPWIQVYRKPLVGILATGDEIVMPGEAKTDYQIYSSNSLMITNMVNAMGADGRNVGIAGDTEESLRDHLQDIEKYDLFVTIGGVSVGDYDLVQKVLGQEGMDLSFYKIAIKPGKPFMHGVIKGTPVMGLPGHPVSSFVTAHIFLRAALKKMMGLSFIRDTFEKAILTKDVKSNGPRMEFMRGVLSEKSDGQKTVEPFMGQDSTLLSVLSQANAFIIRPIEGEALKAGDEVDVLKIADSLVSV